MRLSNAKGRLLTARRKREVDQAMQITDVRIRTISDEGKMKAIASITFDGEFVVHDIKIIEGQGGCFIAMPSRKMADNEYRDIAHPLSTETRNRIKEAIFAAYDAALAAAADAGTVEA